MQPDRSEIAHPMKLLAHCIYTIVDKSRLQDASRDGSVSAPLKEGKPWVRGSQLLQEAKAANKALAVLFADAADCSKLLAWGLVHNIEIHEKTTEFTFTALRTIVDHSPQELILARTGQAIAPQFIRPYAICKTPTFLTEAPSVLHPGLLPDEIIGIEGKSREILRRHRHRERKLRKAKVRQVLQAEGRLRCEVPRCGFDFFDVYGELGRDFCHVHHLKPLANVDEPIATSLADLAIVCANCHAIIHRGRDSRRMEELIARRQPEGR